ncbi:uncharacterized protein PRD47_018602 [Ara ararauna]
MGAVGAVQCRGSPAGGSTEAAPLSGSRGRSSSARQRRRSLSTGPGGGHREEEPGSGGLRGREGLPLSRCPDPGIPIPVFRYRYRYPGIPIPVSRYRYRYPGAPIPVSPYRYPGIPMPLSRYRYRYPGIPIPVSRYRYLYPDACIPVPLSRYPDAPIPVPVSLSRCLYPGTAIPVPRSRYPDPCIPMPLFRSRCSRPGPAPVALSPRGHVRGRTCLRWAPPTRSPIGSRAPVVGGDSAPRHAPWLLVGRRCPMRSRPAADWPEEVRQRPRPSMRRQGLPFTWAPWLRPLSPPTNGRRPWRDVTAKGAGRCYIMREGARATTWGETPPTPLCPPTGPHWAYEGPHGQQHWPEGHPACGGRAQSPIDIRTARVQTDPSLPPVRPEGYESPGAALLPLSNNGHTAVLELPPSLRLRGLPRSFAAAQLHFHWGGEGRSGGAEHLLDGHRAAAEMHVVHYDVEHYGNASDAQHHSGGLAVLGVLLEVGADPHPAYANILKHLSSIRYAGQRTSIPSFSIRDLLPSRLDLYYRYNGSLTTPPCFQSVLWTLFQQPVHISRAQLEQLQGTLYSTGASEAEPQLLEGNFRVPQELNQRRVLSSFPRAPEGYSTGEAIAIIMGALGGCIGLFLSIHFVGKRMCSGRRTQEQDVVFKASSHRAPSNSHP